MAYKKLSEVGGTSSFDSLLAVSGGVVSQVSDEDINSHYGIDEIKANIDNIEVNIDEVEANIDVVEESIARNANRIDILKSNLISLTAEGENISINDSGNGSLVDLVIAGKSEQTQYTGKNLLPLTVDNLKTINNVGTWSGNVYTHEGWSYALNTDDSNIIKSITIDGTTTGASYFYFTTSLIPNTENETLTISGISTLRIAYTDGTWRAALSGTTINVGSSGILQTWIGNTNEVGTQINNVTIYPQLELGSEATDYEPYCGGIPSPNPDYPQAINSSARKGKNLLNIVNSGVAVGVTETVSNGMVSFSGTAINDGGRVTFRRSELLTLEPGTYTLSIITPSGTAPAPCISGENGAMIRNDQGVFTITEVTTGYLGFNYANGVTYNAQNVKVQLELGDVITDYEPYIGDSNIIAMKSIGKNFFNNVAVTETRNGITFTINEDKSVTINGTATANIYFALGEFSIPNGSYVFSGCEDGSASSHLLYLQKNDSSGYIDIKTAEKKFTISDQDPRQVLIAVYSGATVSNVTLYPMIRQDGVDDTYEPYKYSNSNITLTEPLRSLPNGTKDEIIYNSDGTGKIIRRVGVFEIVAESVSNTMFDNGTNALVVNLPNKVVSWHEDTSNLLCSKVIAKAYSEGYTNGMYQNAYNVVLVGDIDDTIEEVRAKYLGSELYYQLATPTEESLTSEQLREIENLQTYRTITNIYTDDIVKSNLQVSYVVDTKTYIDNKFTELATAMLNS